MFELIVIIILLGCVSGMLLEGIAAAIEEYADNNLN